jgi:hypothetical protein
MLRLSHSGPTPHSRTLRSGSPRRMCPDRIFLGPHASPLAILDPVPGCAPMDHGGLCNVCGPDFSRCRRMNRVSGPDFFQPRVRCRAGTWVRRPRSRPAGGTYCRQEAHTSNGEPKGPYFYSARKHRFVQGQFLTGAHARWCSLRPPRPPVRIVPAIHDDQSVSLPASSSSNSRSFLPVGTANKRLHPLFGSWHPVCIRPFDS